MVKEELANENALVYHISKISKSWNLNNPYFLSMQDLLLGRSGTKLKNLRKEQEFHFIAKIINDELNKNNKEVKDNCRQISFLLNSYLNKKQQKDGDKTIRFLFYVFLLKLFNKNNHFKCIDNKKVKKFLMEYKTLSSNLKKFHKILSIYYLGLIEEVGKEEIKDNFDLSLSILYQRLLLSGKSRREKNRLIDYYLKQSVIEKIDLTATSEISKGKLLEIAVILKSANNKGLYIPQIEKEQYLTAFSKKIVREKYLSILKDISSIKLLKSKIPLWLVILGFFLLESLVFALPNFIESISIGSLSISTRTLLNLPIWSILIINGLIISLFLFIIQRNINKRISDERWK